VGFEPRRLETLYQESPFSPFSNPANDRFFPEFPIYFIPRVQVLGNSGLCFMLHAGMADDGGWRMADGGWRMVDRLLGMYFERKSMGQIVEGWLLRV
jgi:hypothetical protein